MAQREGNRTKLLRLGMYEDLLGASNLPAVSNPATLAVNPATGGLTVIDGSEIVTVDATDVRKPEPPVRRADAAALALRDPQGATFDAAAGTWLILDNAARAVVRVPALSGGGAPEQISLDALGASRLQGLAFNPQDRLVYVASPKDDRLYGLDHTGTVQKVFRLDALGLRDLQAMLFAPSADPTDDPVTQHLYIADAGGPTQGRVVEATLSATAVATAPLVNATHIQTINTSQYSPPSPDPAGVTYVAASDRFLISDSEVDEMTIYQGKNLYTGTRTGSGTGTGTTVAYSQEPTGLAFNPADNTLFISDDDRNKVFMARPGPDGTHGTADDSVTNFSTSTFGDLDAEDVAYDTTSGHLFVTDGVAVEVYDVDPVNGVFGDGNDVVTHFDVGQYGARDAEGIGIDPQRNLLLVVDPSTKDIYELTKSGALVRTIECSAIPTTNRLFADVTMAPTSNPTDSPSTLDYWIVDRQVDNGSDPNENDGKLYEVTAPSADAPPTVTITSPADGATVSGTVVVQASASDDVGVSQVAFSVDGTSIGTDVDGANGWSASWNTSGVADGPHNITATATDTFGQIATDSNGVTVDNLDSPPSVAVTAPAEGATVSGTVVVQASASDDVGVTQVAFSVDGTSLGADTNGADGWSVSWNSTGVGDGPHTVTATATDTAGETASDSNGVTVHNVDSPPSVSVTAPAEGATVRGTVAVSATASDDNGVTEVAFSVDGTSVGTDTNGADGWSASWNTSGAGDGPHSVTATATDTLGQKASDSNGVTVDNTAPSVAVTSPAAGATVAGTVTVEASASDNGSVASVQFRADGASIGTDMNGGNGWSVSWDSTMTADGSHSLDAIARDAAGNATTSAPVPVVVDNPDVVVRNVPVAVGGDDGDELQGGTVRRTVGDLELGTDAGTPTTVGLRFVGVQVPQGATITRAYVQFQMDEKGTTATSLNVQAENSNNAAAFTSTAFAISSRPRTTASVGWTPPPWTVVAAAGPDERTPDIRSVAQEVVNRPGWAAGNAMVIIVTGSGRRTAESFEGGAPPILHLEYTTSVDSTPPVVAVTSPIAGSTVSGAVTLQATATDNHSVASVQFRVDETNVGTDTNGADGWSVSWNSEAIADGSHSVDAVATDVSGNTTTSAPVLVNVDNPDTLIRDIPVRVGVDDADELPDGTIRRTGGDIEFGTDHGTPTTVALRFTGVDVPRDATITGAYVQFQTDEKGTSATSLTIRAESADSAAGFTTTPFGISSRPRTTASVLWTPPAWTVIGASEADQRTANLSSVLQEIVSRPGWTAGNAMALMITGSGRRTAESFEGGAAPTLHIEYSRP